MMVRMLLKSCATPPASWPMASIFCDCRNCSSSRLCDGDIAEQAQEQARFAAGFHVGIGDLKNHAATVVQMVLAFALVLAACRR